MLMAQDKLPDDSNSLPRMGLVDESFAADSIGEKYIMSPQEIEDALGWTVGGQIKGYATGSRKRYYLLMQGLERVVL